MPKKKVNCAETIRELFREQGNIPNSEMQDLLKRVGLSATSSQLSDGRRQVFGEAKKRKDPASSSAPEEAGCPACARLQAQNVILRRIIDMLLALE